MRAGTAGKDTDRGRGRANFDSSRRGGGPEHPPPPRGWAPRPPGGTQAALGIHCRGGFQNPNRHLGGGGFRVLHSHRCLRGPRTRAPRDSQSSGGMGTGAPFSLVEMRIMGRRRGAAALRPHTGRLINVTEQHQEEQKRAWLNCVDTVCSCGCPICIHNGR